MATPNQTNPSGGPQTIDPKQLSAGLKNLLEDQGDYNNLLKDTIKELGQMDRAYSKIEARLATLNSDSINVKQVNRDLLLLKQKEYIEDKKLQDLQKSYSNTTKDVLAAAKALAKYDQEQYAKQGIAFDLEEEILYNLKQKGNLEAAALYAQEIKLKIAGKQVESGKAMLANEKAVNTQLGISGNLVKAFATKLGFGEEAYSAMALKARKLTEEQKNLNGLSYTFSKILGFWQVAGVGAKSVIKSAFSSLLDPAIALPIVGGLVKGFSQLVEFALSAQDRTVKFGRALGMSGDSALKVRNEFSKIAFQSNSIFINSEKLMQSQEELTGILGTNNILSGKILETNSLLKDIAGLEAETRGEIVQSSIITGKSVEATTKSVLAQVVGLQKATGIGFNFQKILKEASSLGGYLGLSFAKYPDKLTKSLVTVKAMGLELKQLDSMADSFLDFESSISNEFEAQLLTGKNINLMKAREAFLNNDLAGAAAEITSQVGSSGDFLKMNRIQAESLSKAFGMSRDQLGEMLKKQELLSRIGAKDTDNAQKQLQIGLQKFGNQKALAEAVGEEAYNSMLNASAQEKISAFMEKIKQSIADFVANSPLIPMIERAIDFLSKPSNIQKIISYVQSGFALIFDIIGNTAGVMMKLGNFFGAGISEDLISTVMAGGDSIRAMNLAGPVTVGSNKVKNETGMSSQSAAPMAAPPAIAPENKMNILVQNDMMTGKSVVTFLNTDPGTRFDKSNIIYAS
jgi:hypothetical protein